jgi:hypothetical protein
MASLKPVAAGFTVVPSRDRERDYLRYLVRRSEPGVPLEEALFDIRTTEDGTHVMLLPFRSYDAARRLLKAFEKAAKDHQKAEKERTRFTALDD